VLNKHPIFFTRRALVDGLKPALHPQAREFRVRKPFENFFIGQQIFKFFLKNHKKTIAILLYL